MKIISVSFYNLIYHQYPLIKKKTYFPCGTLSIPFHWPAQTPYPSDMKFQKEIKIFKTNGLK